MSRFDGEYDDPYPNAWALWESATTQALGSAKGQQILRDLRDALIALSEKRLISGRLACNGEVCTMGALVVHRRRGEGREKVLAELEKLIGDDDVWEAEEQTIAAGNGVGVGVALASHLAWLNDQLEYGATPEARYTKVLAWAERAILEPAS